MLIPYNYIVEQMTSVLIKTIYDNINYIDTNGDYKKIRVGFSNGRKDVLDKLYREDRPIGSILMENVLPAISLSLSGGYETIDDLRLIKANKVKINSLKGFTPIPKRLTYNGVIGTGKLRTMFNIMEQLDILFDQQHTIDVKYPILKGESISTQFIYEFNSIDEGVSGSLGEEDNDVILASFNITVEPVWLFKPMKEIKDIKSIINVSGYTFYTELP